MVQKLQTPRKIKTTARILMNIKAPFRKLTGTKCYVEELAMSPI